MTAHPDDHLGPTEFLDCDHPTVRQFAERAAGDAVNPVDRAVRLYYAVRDSIHYEVYGRDLSRTGMKASSVIDAGTGFCIHKSVAYAAAGRALGVPTRLVLTDVRNHLASDRLQQLVGGDVFRFHALVSVHLEGRWVRATPVFNRTLCRLYQIKPLDFDGRADSVYHPYDEDGRRHMEFLHEHGEFGDFPYQMVIEGIRAAHPGLFAGRHTLRQGSLVDEASPVDRAAPTRP